MADNDPGYLRLYWPGGQNAAGVTLVARHAWRPFTSEELRQFAETVKAIEDFRELVSDPEGLEIP